MPAALEARMRSVKRTAANSTDGLIAALAPLAPYGLDATQQAIVGFGRFPVAGPARWSDDWWMPRHTDGRWRLHEGVDIFAAAGTPVRAPVDGVVRVTNGGLGGLAVTVRQPDGTYWYLCHLSAIALGMVDGVTVATGQVVGFVGDSGDAKGGPPHLHLEVHPRGGAAVPPKPVIDRFVADAIARAPQLVAAYAAARQASAEVTPPALPALTLEDALLWMSAANPTAGALRLVQAAADEAASHIDWSRR
jgi:murein DD-endopeptidase MepM/ murein hydrolase activator NlpD